MINPGPYFRRRFPKLYFPFILLINLIKNALRPYSVYITDSLGGSFKDYFLNSDMPVRLADLKRNLDKESVETIDVIVKRMLNYPDEKYKQKISKHKEIIGGLLPVESDLNKSKIKKELRKIKEDLKIPSKHLTEGVFYYYHGLRLLPHQITEYIRGGDFIDAGAFIGDSAIALREYNYNKIYSVEISPKSVARYKLNLSRCKIDSSRYEIINAGIAADDNHHPAKFSDTGSAGLSLLRDRGKYDLTEVSQKSIDAIVREYNISPRLIKADLEGKAFDLIMGAKQTLVKYRPVLSIAIYHNPAEFFEVKPLLEQILPDYTFMIRKLSSGTKFNECHSEVILLGYPGL